MSIDNALFWLDLFGVAVFAVSGSLVAGRKHMDVFGVLVVALVTAIGGGTLRDLLLGVPPFWMTRTVYLYVGIGAGLTTFILARIARIPERALLTADALGLGVFTILGCRKGLSAETPRLVALILGMMTGVAGGMLRDILCGEVPLIMRREIYATASLAGGLVYVAAKALELPPLAAIPLGLLTVICARVAAIHWGLALPTFREKLE